jgi:hypothetical protein
MAVNWFVSVFGNTVTLGVRRDLLVRLRGRTFAGRIVDGRWGKLAEGTEIVHRQEIFRSREEAHATAERWKTEAENLLEGH